VNDMSPLGSGKGGIMVPFDTKMPEVDDPDEAEVLSDDSSDSESDKEDGKLTADKK
jgi:hypothetical protein